MAASSASSNAEHHIVYMAGGLPLDENTVARAALTFCIDSADALMYALVRGAPDVAHILHLLITLQTTKSTDRTDERNELDSLFATGVSRWGRSVDARSMKAFHAALTRWLRRLSSLPVHSMTALAAALSNDGSQWIIAPHSSYWPHQLEDLSIRSDWAPPLCLWGRGNPSALISCDSPLAIVGSRAADDYGRNTAYNIARAAAQSGHLVISGGAMGIDAAAHNGVLSTINHNTSTGSTIAVFAGGLNHIGPQCNRRLFDRIETSNGALISELCPNTIPEARRFLLRNRLIAALSSSVIVAQARWRSGALNTANWAVELGRTVYAVPGDITMPNNAGCNKLIHDGKAIIIHTVDCVDDICHPAHHVTTEHNVSTTHAAPTETEKADAMPESSATPASPTASPTSSTPTERCQPNTDLAHATAVYSSEDIIAAIRTCLRNNTVATVDNICATLAIQHPHNQPTVDTVLTQLAMLELEEHITVESGCYKISRRHTHT